MSLCSVCPKDGHKEHEETQSTPRLKINFTIHLSRLLIHVINFDHWNFKKNYEPGC